MTQIDENNFYRNYCLESNHSVEPSVKKALKNASVVGEFDISGRPLGKESCEAIAHILSNSRNLISLNFTDCMLSTESLILILESLERNKSVRELNLYGNNITSIGTAKLGKLLSLNSSIKKLLLKWNNIGSSVDSFMTFCDGIKENRSLELLDLRNNQISQDSAKDIADLIISNSSLKHLDLRWNSIQNEGAEEILKSLKENTTLEILSLKGNFIRKDILESIEEKMNNNVLISKLNPEQMTSNVFIDHIKSLEEKNAKQLSKITEAANKHMKEAEKRLTETMEENRNLQLKMNELEEEVFTLKTKLKNEVQKEESFDEVLKEKELSHQLQIAAYQSKIDNLQKLDEINNNTNSDKQLIVELEEELIFEKQNCFALQSELDSTRNQSESRIKLLEDKYENEKRIWMEKYKNLEDAYNIKIEKQKSYSQEKLQNLENTILELTEKQTSKVLMINDRVEKIKQERRQIEEHLNAAQTTVIQLQRENAELFSQVTEPTRKLTGLLEELSNEKMLNQQLKHEKLEEKKRCEILENDLEIERRDKLAIKNQIKNQEEHFEQIIRDLKHRCRHLEVKIEEKERKIGTIRIFYLVAMTSLISLCSLSYFMNKFF